MVEESIKFGFFHNEVESPPSSTPRGHEEEEEKSRVHTLSTSRGTLPQCKLTASLGVSASEVMKVFDAVCKAKSFQIIESEELLATAVYREPFSFRKLFSYCLPSKNTGSEGGRSSMVSAVKLHIHVSEANLTRNIYVKGFYGVVPVLREIVNEFRRKMQKEIDKIDGPSTNDDTSFERRRDSIKPAISKRNVHQKLPQKTYSQL